MLRCAHTARFVLVDVDSILNMYVCIYIYICSIRTSYFLRDYTIRYIVLGCDLLREGRRFCMTVVI